MANPKFTNRKLVLAMSPDFMVQPAWGTAIAPAELDYRHPQTTPQRHGVQAFREQTRSCDARYVVIEELTGKIARFTLGFAASAKFLAGHFAYLQGVAAAPTGTPANESQTLDLNGATGGDITLELDHEGLDGPTAAISTTAALTAATIQAALEATRSIKEGNVSVSGSAGGPFTISFINRLANANLPLLTLVDNSTGGSGVSIVEAAAGENKLHAISRSDSEYPALWSAIEGFDGETGGMKRYKDLVTDSWTLSINRRGKANLTVVAYGDPIGELIEGYSTPVCQNPTPVSAKDSRIEIGDGIGFLGGDLRELTIACSNNIDVSEEALRWDDITPDQLAAGDPTSEINALVTGSPTSAFSEFAENENEAFTDLKIHLGRPGERFSYLADNVQFRLDDNLTEFVGGRNVSAFRVLGRPSPDGSGIVDYGEYHGAYTGQFLLSA